MPCVYVVVGIPASGKSTAAAMIASKTHAYLIESDKIRFSNFSEPQYSASENFQVFSIAFDEIHRAVKYDRNVVFDATNIRRSQREKIISEFPVHYEKRCLFMNTGIVTCLLRNESRERRVPDSVIERMYDALEPPTEQEGFCEVFTITTA